MNRDLRFIILLSGGLICLAIALLFYLRLPPSPVDRVTGNSLEEVYRDLARIKNKMSDKKAAEFVHAITVLRDMDLRDSMESGETLEVIFVRRFNGKSPAEIMSDYNAIDPGDIRRMLAARENAQKRAEKYKKKKAPPAIEEAAPDSPN